MDGREGGMSSRRLHLKPIAGVLFVCLLAFALQIFYFCPISPDVLHLPSPSSSHEAPTTHHFQGAVVKIGEGILKSPEAICVDEKGRTLYTATRDGWIKRLHPNGTWEDWKMVGSSPTLLGITYSTLTNHILACDNEKGLLKVGDDGVTVLASHVNGSRIRFANDVIAASDGTAYFTVSSTKFRPRDAFLDVLEARPHGQVLRYDASSNETSVLLDGLCFANGIALSKDQDYLAVCESWKFRCLKHWLKGEMKGKTEVLVDNLPGAPDNINLSPDGSFWIAVAQLTRRGFEFVHASKVLKRAIAVSPKLMGLVSGLNGRATVVKVAADGEITRKMDDPRAAVMSLVTTAVEFENHLYLASLNADFIGKLRLDNA